MTVDDLMTLFQSARQGTRDWNGTEWVGVYGGDRAGVTAIVRALRDETRHMTLNRDGLEELFTQILGSDAEEKVAEGIAERADEQRADAPATDPIRDAAPAVCVWLDDGNQRKRRRNSCGLQGANQSWAGMNWICTGCLKPIKFTEANHG